MSTTLKDYYKTRFTGSYGNGMYDIRALMRTSSMRQWFCKNTCFRYLEVGAGQGNFPLAFVNYLTRAGMKPTEVAFTDMDNHLTPAAQSLGTFYHCEVGVQPMPFADHHFDIIVCNHVLEHLFETEAALRDMRRLLAPGGVIVLGVPNIGNWYSRIMFLLGYLPLGLECGTESVHYGKGFGQRYAKGFKPSGHIRGFNAKALEDICYQCGLDVKDWWNQGHELHAKLMYRYLGAVVKPI